MRRLKSSFILAALGAAMVFVAGSGASAAEITKLQVNNWRGGAFSNDQTGAFSHCAASAHYKSGITLLFSVTASGVWSMGFSSPNWQLVPNSSYPVQYSVDDGAALQGTAVAKTAQLAQVMLPANSSIFDAFRLGQLLKVVAEKQTLSFRLTDTSDLLAVLTRCARDHQNAGRNTNPFGSGTRPATPSPPAPSNPFGSGTPPKAAQPITGEKI